MRFKVLHQNETLAVLARKEAKIYIVESPEFAAKDRPEISIETDSIKELYAEISSSRPEMAIRTQELLKRSRGVQKSLRFVTKRTFV